MSKTLLFTTFSFLIIMLLCCGNPTTTEIDPDTLKDIDGNTYKTVKIGYQWWTAENLRTTKYKDGTPIPHLTNDSLWAIDTIGAYCYFWNDSAANAEKYGALYNWHAVNTGKLAPEGWHVPTDADWTELENYLIACGYNWDGTTADNKIGKSMATKTGWIPSSIEGTPGNDMQTNNSTGFSALPGGFRNYIGFFSGQSGFGHWWSATKNDASTAYYRSLTNNLVSLYSGSIRKEYGFSVRLVKN